MPFTLIISEDARWDIRNAFLWYEQQREGLGYDFKLSLEAGLSYIQREPSALQIKYRNMRVHFIRKFPYGIHYIIDNESIKVLGVFHTSRNPIDWNKKK